MGKVEGLIFDHGDFESFVLQDEAGIDHKFFSRERNIRKLAERAKIERLRMSVVAENIGISVKY